MKSTTVGCVSTGNTQTVEFSDRHQTNEVDLVG